MTNLLKCDVLPDSNDCYGCIDTHIDAGRGINCGGCKSFILDCELLSVGVTVFGKEYAFVVTPNGSIKRVKLDQIVVKREE